MYIQKAKIKNIKSILDFTIEFKNLAGWHVFIGDNGAGKSTILRGIALGIVGTQFDGLRANWDDWLNKDAESGEIVTDLSKDEDVDIYDFFVKKDNSDEFEKDDSLHFKVLTRRLSFSRNILSRSTSHVDVNGQTFLDGTINLTEKLASYKSSGLPSKFDFHGFFSSGYGPYRRFEGGNSEWTELFTNPNYANLAAHLSIFGEDVALTEAISWLKDLNYKALEKKEESKYVLSNLKKLINSENFLPHNAQLATVSSEGVFFKDPSGCIVSVNQMSDGYRSILSMTFELLRQLVRVYDPERVFRNVEKGESVIDLPGVVLIDEIDAHLHPTWQTRIGQWFTRYFPNIQFIVTTHSPLVCRAAETGSIWRLAAPGSGQESGEITGQDRDRLVYGNVLDAYGTEVFGENVSISQESDEMLNRLAELNVKSMMGEIDETEHAELESLKAVLPTESKL